jgi:starch-binding outer membrane protein SusE/F
MKTIMKSALLISALSLSFTACKKDKKTVVEEETPTPTPTPTVKSTYLYVPGNYQGWDPKVADSIANVKDSAGKFFGFINFAAAASGTNDFKLTTKRSWDYDFGLDGTSTTTDNGDPANKVVTGSIKGKASDIKLPSFGIYQLEVDTVGKKIVARKAEWGLVGSATTGTGAGWNSSKPMTYNPVTKMFEIKNVALKLDSASGANTFIKFRPNNNWQWTDYGTPNNDKTFVSGTELKEKGTDIVITAAGNYDITLDLSVKGKAKATIVKK